MEELNIVLRAVGKRKASGPDAIPAELLQNAPYIFRLYLLDHYNHCFQQGQAPSSWLHSEVVMLVKLKTIKKTQSFSPTIDPSPLLIPCTRFMLPSCKKRLAAHFDSRLRPTQFGFRSGRSVTQPIRRLLEVHERQTEAFHAIFLDWAKAFDSVTFSSIQSSLEYMGVPPRSEQQSHLFIKTPLLRSGRVSTAPMYIRKLGASDRAAPSLLTYLVLCSRISLRAQNRNMLRSMVSSPGFLG